MFSVFINYLNEGIESTLSKFADHVKLGGDTDMPEGCAAGQQNLDSVLSWTESNLMMFSKSNCRVLLLKRNNCMC